MALKPSAWSDSNRLTRSEIDSLRQSKKSIADYVQKEFQGRLNQQGMGHMLTGMAEGHYSTEINEVRERLAAQHKSAKSKT